MLTIYNLLITKMIWSMTDDSFTVWTVCFVISCTFVLSLIKYILINMSIWKKKAFLNKIHPTLASYASFFLLQYPEFTAKWDPSHVMIHEVTVRSPRSVTSVLYCSFPAIYCSRMWYKNIIFNNSKMGKVVRNNDLYWASH